MNDLSLNLLALGSEQKLITVRKGRKLPQLRHTTPQTLARLFCVRVL